MKTTTAVARGRRTQPRRTSVAEDHHFSEGERICVRDGDQRASPSDFREPNAGAAMQLELRRSPAADDFDVAPEDALRVPGAERLHRRFLGRETTGEMNGRAPAGCAVRDFGVAEDPLDEPIAVPLHGVGNAIDFGGVESQTDDVWHDED